jgi:hypothetical protein
LAVDADLHEFHERRNVIGHPGHELVERGGCRRPVLVGDRRVGGHVDALERPLGAELADPAPEQHQFLAPRRLHPEDLLQQFPAGLEPARSQLDFREDEL